MADAGAAAPEPPPPPQPPDPGAAAAAADAPATAANDGEGAGGGEQLTAASPAAHPLDWAVDSAQFISDADRQVSVLSLVFDENAELGQPRRMSSDVLARRVSSLRANPPTSLVKVLP